MLRKLLKLLPLTVLLLFTLPVRAAVSVHNQPGASGFHQRLHPDAFAAEGPAETSLVSQLSQLKLPLQFPGLPASGVRSLYLPETTTAQTGRLRSRPVRPTAALLLYPFHVFW